MFDLTLEFLEQEGVLRRRMEYNTALFGRATITQAARALFVRYWRLSFQKSPATTGQFTFLTDEERRQLLVESAGPSGLRLSPDNVYSPPD